MAASVAVGCYTTASNDSAGSATSAATVVRKAELAAHLSPRARSGGADEAPTTPPPAAAASVTAAAIPSLLSSNLLRVPVEQGVVSSVEVSCYNANPSIEDSYVIEPQLQTDPSNGCAVGVFDGHSGSAASVFLRRHLLPHLQQRQQLSRNGDPLLHPAAFVEADTHFLNTNWLWGRPADGLSGACYNVVQLSGSQVHCASAGDVRAIVARRRTEPPVGAVRDGRPNSTHVAIPLSWDHQIDVNPAERERLLAAHPNEPDVIRRNRVKGRLQPTRGFGDGAYKEPRYWHYRNTQSANGGKSSPYHHPYTTAEPDVHTLQLQPGDDFVIVATDGLFQDMSSQEAVDYAAEFIQQQSAGQRAETDSTASSWSSWLPGFLRSAPAAAAAASPPKQLSSLAWPSCSTFLLSRALLHASEKHIGRRLTDAENLQWIARLPLIERRNVHDDVTVVVIHLKHDGGGDRTAVQSSGSSFVAPPQSQIQSRL